MRKSPTRNPTPCRTLPYHTGSTSPYFTFCVASALMLVPLLWGWSSRAPFNYWLLQPMEGSGRREVSYNAEFMRF